MMILNPGHQFIQSEGDLAEERNKAIGIQAVGEAEADAKMKLNMADVNPEITLAQEIGENTGYQNFLNAEKAIKANESIGVASAEALAKGDLRVIVNSGDTNSGVNSLMDLFNGAKGGTALGAIADGLMNTDGGKAIMESMGVTIAAKDNAIAPTVVTDDSASDPEVDDKVA